MPNFDDLKKILKDFAEKYKGANGDLSAKVTGIIADAGKNVVDSITGKSSQEKAGEVIRDFYDLLTSGKTTDAISGLFGNFDEASIQEKIDGFMARLKDPEKMEQIVHVLKDVLEKTSPEELCDQLGALLSQSKMPEEEKAQYSMLLSQVVQPMLQSIKDSPEDMAAAQIAVLFDMLSTDMLAAQAAELVRPISPEGISTTINDAVKKLPSPQAVSTVLGEIGKIVNEGLDDIKASGTFSGASKTFKEAGKKIKDIAKDAFAQDQTNKKKLRFRRKGGSFDL